MVIGSQVFQQHTCIHLPTGFFCFVQLFGFFYRPAPLHFEALIMLTKLHTYLKLQELEEDVQVKNLFASGNLILVPVNCHLEQLKLVIAIAGEKRTLELSSMFYISAIQ